MRIASVLTPMSDHNLSLASQLGVTDIVIRYPGRDIKKLLTLRDEVERFSMKISVIEGLLPIENIKLGNEKRDHEIEGIKLLISNMAKAKIPIICYNFMTGADWSRTSFNNRERGGALVSSFNLSEAPKVLKFDGVLTPKEQLWENLEYFLKEIIPVAEKNDVILAMHPDDPPVESLLGKDRIMNSVENFERLVSIVPSKSNAICFCQGCFAEMGVDIPSTIRRLGKKIKYVHFRDIRGSRNNFDETFHDNGPTDMFEAICAYREISFQGPMRPDHVPQLDGEEDGIPFYTMLGRLFAYGYMRGLIQAAEHKS